MTDDLQVSNSIASFIRFIKRNKNTLLLFVLIGVVSTIFFQKLKKPYYTTEAICSSGISEYERMEQVQEMSQRTAVDLINLIDINAQNKDSVSYTHLRAHETPEHLVCRLLLEKKKNHER